MSLKNIVVIGGGVLGSQIAYQTAYKGFPVTIWLRSPASIDRARPKLERLHGIYTAELNAARTSDGPYSAGLLENGKKYTDAEIDKRIAAADAALRDMKLTTDLADAVKDADLVIEALAEDINQKIDFYKMLAPLLPEKTIVATNSSTLLPSAMAEYTQRPEKYLALHFANNIWSGNTAEIMGHAGTDPENYRAVVQFAEDISMVPLEVKKEQPGYILNSMLVPFLEAAEFLWANDIADYETIDKTWVLATHAPMGPFRVIDVVGITTVYNITLSRPGADDPNTVYGKLAKRLKEEFIDTGKLGVNAGEGFYKYK
ncbi:MAG: 3-hydroxyacyl-CoA dehydrogenase [Clostridiales bacterium]|nr:3-hydroxyacyl-CoA dehydrogenase [Clostridiales bacterium]